MRADPFTGDLLPTSEPADKRILVVDDDADIRLTASMILEAEGFEVSTADSVGTAIRLLRSTAAPAAILTDLWMSPFNGLDLREMVRKEPAWSRIPMVFMTAVVESEARRLNLGVWIRKPFDEDKLIDALRSVIRGEAATSEVNAAMRSQR